MRDVWIVLLNVTAMGLGLLFLWEMRTLVSWVLVALFLALALHPAVAWLAGHGFRRGWAVLAVFVVGLALVIALFGTLVPMLAEQGKSLVERLPDLVERIKESKPVEWADRRFQVLEKIQSAVEETENMASPAWTAAKGVLQGIVAVITVITLTIFMLLFGGDVFEKILTWLPPKQRERWQSLAERMQKVVGGYVAGTFMVAAIGGIVMGTTLAILKVPYFLPLGLAMVVFGIIPFLGSLLGAMLLVGITFASMGTKAGLICAGVYLVYQQIENEILQPLVQNRTLRMNPLLITLALLVGSGIAGILGTLLALPIAGAIQVLLQDTLHNPDQG